MATHNSIEALTLHHLLGWLAIIYVKNTLFNEFFISIIVKNVKNIMCTMQYYFKRASHFSHS